MSVFKKTVILVVSLVAMFSVSAAVLAATASTDENAEAKQYIADKVSCQQLSDGQLEKIGDYVMEQMAPGAAHGQMEQMMGGEGTESLRQAHIFLARRWYCGDVAGYSMMGMMMGGFGPSMMGPGGNLNGPGFSRGFSNGMMGSFGGYNNYGGGWVMIFYALGIIFLAVGIAAFVKYLANKK